MSTAAFPPVRALLPQAGSMVLLDEVLEAGEGWLVARVRIRPDLAFVRAAGMPAWIGLELMAQAVAALGGLRARARVEPPRAGLLLGTRCYEAHVPVFAMDSVLDVRVEEALRADNGMQSFACRILAGDRLCAEARINVYEPPEGVEALRGDGTVTSSADPHTRAQRMP